MPHLSHFRHRRTLCTHAQARLGKAYYQLGMLRDAEKQFLSSLKQQEMVLTYLELAKVYLKLDQPNSALDMYETRALFLIFSLALIEFF